MEGLDNLSTASMSTKRFPSKGGREESRWAETRLSTMGPLDLEVEGEKDK